MRRNQYQWCTISRLKWSEWTYWSQSAGAQISQAKLELCKKGHYLQEIIFNRSGDMAKNVNTVRKYKNFEHK